jgi:hypothetical protein
LCDRLPLDRWTVGPLDRWIVGSLDRWIVVGDAVYRIVTTDSATFPRVSLATM